MREYQKVLPGFWTGPTGKALKALGRDAKFMASYLMTCPHVEPTGLYYLPWPALCYEAGFTENEAAAALEAVEFSGFAFYDREHEMAWVPELARVQIAEALKPKDSRIKMVKALLRAYRNHPYVSEFLEKYGEAYHLTCSCCPHSGHNRPKTTTDDQERPISGAGTGTEAGAGTEGAPPAAPPPIKPADGLPPRVPVEPALQRYVSPPNPLVDDERREALRQEWHELIREEAAATGKDGETVAKRHATWTDREGKNHHKLNPASMSDDHLLNTLMSLREAKAAREKPAAERPRVLSPEEAQARSAAVIEERRAVTEAGARAFREAVNGKAGRAGPAGEAGSGEGGGAGGRGAGEGDPGPGGRGSRGPPDS